MSLQVQFVTFFMMFSSGWILGIIFDVYRVVSKPFNLGRWLLSFWDIVYWCIATLVVFRILYLSNQGEVRFFVFMGLLLGTWFYFSFISTSTMKTIEYLISFVQRMFQIGMKCVNILIVKPLVMIYRIIIILLGFIAVFTIFLSKVVVQLFHPLWLVLKWALNGINKIIPCPLWISVIMKRIQEAFKRFF